jgi:hypothetical protein
VWSSVEANNKASTPRQNKTQINVFLFWCFYYRL